MPCQNAGSKGRSSPGRHAPATRAACPGNSGGMRRRIGRHAAAGGSLGGLDRRLRRHATAAPPACATILAIMPTSTEPIPARVPCQDAIPYDALPYDALPYDALLPSIRAVA